MKETIVSYRVRSMAVAIIGFFLVLAIWSLLALRSHRSGNGSGPGTPKAGTYPQEPLVHGATDTPLPGALPIEPGAIPGNDDPGKHRTGADITYVLDIIDQAAPGMRPVAPNIVHLDPEWARTHMQPVILQHVVDAPRQQKYLLWCEGIQSDKTVTHVGILTQALAPTAQPALYRRSESVSWIDNIEEVLEIPDEESTIRPSGSIQGGLSPAEAVAAWEALPALDNFVNAKPESPVYPDTPVSLGSVWHSPDGLPEDKSYRYEVVGYATVNGDEAIVIRRQRQLKGQGRATFSWDDVFYVRPGDGTVLYGDCRLVVEGRRHIDTVCHLSRLAD